MAIVSCPECSKKLKVADTSVGKKVKCSCGNVFVASTNGVAAAAPAPAAADKVIVACTECGSKLKVGTASLGKKMKCPKCAAVFVAAEDAPKKTAPKPPPEPELEDEFEEHAPKKKAKAVSDEDMDDLLSFAESDAKDDDNPFQDEDEPKPKAKAKKSDETFEDDEVPVMKKADDEDDEPKPKSKSAQRGAPPPRFSDEAEKPVYPRRTLLNLFVFFLLFLFVGGFAVVFVVYPLGLGKLKEDKIRKEPPVVKDELEGQWSIVSAEAGGKPQPDLKGHLWEFADDKVTAPKIKAAPYKTNHSVSPRVIDIATDFVTLAGIYEVEGDTLKLCFAETKMVKEGNKEVAVPGERPTKFESQNALLLTLKREKKAEDADKDKGNDQAKADAAKGQLRVLTLAAQAYALKNDAKFPETLQDLVDGKFLENQNALVDPWQNLYQYNAQGPKNGGKTPDIWTVTPAKEMIGNWASKALDKDKAKDGDKAKGNDKVNAAIALSQVKTLSLAVKAYYLKNDEFPKSLKALLEKTATGGPYLEGNELLFDPWKKPYQYDPAGTKNGGKSPDIWTVTPTNEIIGNWPAETPRSKNGKNDATYSRTQSAKNLTAIGDAIHSHHDVHKLLPPAFISARGDTMDKPLLSWRVAILPYLKEEKLYFEFDLDKPWDDPHNKKLIAKMPKVYVVPGVEAKEGMTHYRTLVTTPFREPNEQGRFITALDPFSGRGRTYARYTLNRMPDGATNVLMAVEATEPTIWTKPDDLPYNPEGPLPKFGLASAGFNVLLCDGRVVFVPPAVPDVALRPYLTCDNGIVRDWIDRDKAAHLKEAATLAGAWIVESAIIDGKANDSWKGELFMFRGSQLTGFMLGTVDVVFDPTENPKAMTFSISRFPETLAIYKVDAGKLHICRTVRKNDDRPRTFDGKAGDLISLRRPKKGESIYSKNQSEMNLRVIGHAFRNHFDSTNSLPAAALTDGKGKPLLSWRVAILPYFEEFDLYKQFDLDKPWDDPHNMKLVAKMPRFYMVPGVEAKEGMTHYRTLVGPGTLLDPIKGPTGKLVAKYGLDVIPDGSANVIMVVEANEPTIWTKPDDLPYDPKGPLPKFGVAPVGFNVLLADGRVCFVRPSVAEKVLRPYLTCDNKARREPLDPNEKANSKDDKSQK